MRNSIHAHPDTNDPICVSKENFINIDIAEETKTYFFIA